MHDRAVLSKSDSNIKSTKYRSSNALLHSPSSNKNSSKNVKIKETKKKKPLSLQNSEDNPQVQAGASMVMATANGGVLTPPNRSFYDELRAKLFQSSTAPHKSSTTNTASTNISYTNQINERSESPNSPSDPTSIVTVVNTHELDAKNSVSMSSLDKQPQQRQPSLSQAAASSNTSTTRL